MESKRKVLNREIDNFLEWGKSQIDPLTVTEMEEKFTVLLGKNDKSEKLLEIFGKVCFSSDTLTSLICENTGLPEGQIKAYCDKFLRILNM